MFCIVFACNFEEVKFLAKILALYLLLLTVLPSAANAMSCSGSCDAEKSHCSSELSNEQQDSDENNCCSSSSCSCVCCTLLVVPLPTKQKKYTFAKQVFLDKNFSYTSLKGTTHLNCIWQPPKAA